MKYKKGLLFGSFDPLHFGHIRLFSRASELCDEIYVCTESDKIISSEKSREPFTSEQERMEDIRGIKYVKDVGIRRDTREEIVDLFSPDVLIVGDDHAGTWSAGEKIGLPIIYLPYTKEISSTKIRECNKKNIQESI